MFLDKSNLAKRANQRQRIAKTCSKNESNVSRRAR